MAKTEVTVTYSVEQYNDIIRDMKFCFDNNKGILSPKNKFLIECDFDFKGIEQFVGRELSLIEIIEKMNELNIPIEIDFKKQTVTILKPN